jgi:multidrug resistance efflux pump
VTLHPGLPAKLAEMERLGIEVEQTLAILDANLTIAQAEAKGAVEQARAAADRAHAASVRLDELEVDKANALHKQDSLRTAIDAVLDIVERLPMPMPRKKTPPTP